MNVQAINQWRESIPEESQIEMGAGAALLGVGIVAALSSIGRRRRGFFAWAIPGALLSAGATLIVHSLLDVRSDRMAETQASIEAELASLDPLARAYVLKNVSQSQLRAVLPDHS